MKRFLAVSLFLIGCLAAPVSWADHACDKPCCATESKKQCDLSADKCGKCGEQEEKHECPIAGKIMKKAHFFLDNKDELGLSEEQVASIKSIKWQTKKAAILQEANMKVGMMEMEAKLSEPTVDVEGISAMIDQGMAGMAQEAKTSLANYAKLKAVLSDEQMAKAKELWKKK